MQNPSDGHHHRRRDRGSGRGNNNRGARPPWPGNNSTTFSHANFPPLNSPQILQRVNVNPPRPAIPLDRIEAVAARAHAEMVAAGESVSSWKVSQATALALQAGSWGAIGRGFNDVPTLRNIQSVERKVNAFIHCFVSVRRMTSLYDLHNELCKNEGVEKFEEFGIGSLLRHPLIQQYFSIPPDATEICEITIDNLLSSLSTFIYKYKSREIPVEEFLDSLLKKYPVARKEYLGVRITSFGLYIGCLKGIRRNESAMLRTFKESPINVITQAESKLIQSDDYSNSLHHLFSLNGESSSRTKSKLQNLSSSIDRMKSFGLAIEKCGESDFKVIQLDPSKSEVLEVSEPVIRKFVATWKNKCSIHSPNKVLELMSNSCQGKSKRKKLLHLSSSFLGSMLLEIAVKAIKGGFFDHLLENETETARCTSPDFLKGEIYDEVVIEFIEKWREPCNTRPVYEVIALMLHHYVKSSTKSIQKAFLTVPGSALLNLALEVIKGSANNSVEGTSTSFNEPAKPADPKNEPNSEVVPRKEEDNRTVTELKNPPDVTVEGIIMKINSYFGLDCPFDNDNDGYKNNKEIPFIKKLVCHGCEMWLKRELCVKDFLNLGFGSFYEFLDKHIGSLPKELHLLAETNSCNYLEVSLNQKQLHLMLDQARRSLGGKAHLDKTHVCQILRNQFPSISLSVTETNNTVLNASACPYSAHFSSTLITLKQDSRPLDGQVERSGDVGELSIGSFKLVSAKDAKECLIKAPFLTDLQLWSHWDSMFQPSLGPLVEWLLHEGYIEGLSCVVTRSGCVIRVNDHASFDDLVEAFLHGLPAKVALILLSLFVIHGGSHNIPLSLLKYSLQRAVDVRIKSTSFLDHKKTFEDIASFIIDCLDHLPPEFRSFMAQVMVSILCAFTRDAYQIILSQCKKAEKRVMLHEIGLSLGIVEWINDYKEFIAGPMVDLDINLNKVSEASESDGVSLSTVELPGTTIESQAIATKEMSTEFHDKISSDMTTDEQILQGNDLIETIRREEFGLDLGSSFTESALLKKQHARLGRALQCLSNELYSQDSHFILELVQNADDNNYSAGVEPTLVFILHSNGIVVLNNERGFSDKNIRALCDVGNSTKKGLSSGYIGKKGIGFKSVFRVTDAPEIHSNGFHVKFDVSEGQIGFILPTPVVPCDMKYINEQLNDNNQAVGEHWGTCIILPFKPKHKSERGRTFVLSMFSELHPSLLLFLKNLKCIRFKSTLDGTITTMRKESGADGVVLISHGTEAMNWLVVNQELDASELRPEVKTTRIALAFRLNRSSTGEYEPNFNQQPTFAYLPLRQYGMRFILQADFSLPSSREEVDHDSAWNQWLLLKFPDLFVASLKSFCRLSCFRDSPGKAISTFMSFVPLVGEVHGFFTSLPHMILSKLRVSGCLLQEGFDQEWILPCRALRGWDDNVQSVISDSLLQQHAGLGYLKRDIILTDSLAKELSVQEYGPNVLVQILESVCGERGDINALGVEWLSAWLNLFYKTLITQSSENEHDLLARLKKISFVPLSDGSFVSIADGPIWVPCNVSSLQLGDSSAIERFHYLYTNLRTVSPAIFSCHSDVYSSTGGRIESILMVLHKLGVKQLSAHDVIQSHILKYNFGEVVETKKRLIVEYLSFVFDHFQSPCSECCLEKAEIIEKLRKEPIVLTNSGFKSPATESIHFSKEFGNCISVENLICGTGITWHKVDNIYLKNTNYNVTKWRDFLKDLGVSDFVRLTEINKDVKELGLPVRDWVSIELDAFVSEISRTGNLKKSKHLLHVLDELWDDYFCQKVNEQSESLFIQSSFVKTLREFKWVASSLDNELHFPTELFHKHEAVFSVLGTNVPYAIPKVSSKALLKHLGFKVEVQLDDIVSTTQRWKIASSHKASISQMSKFYSLAWERTSSLTEKPEHLKSSLYIFQPFVNPPDQIEAVPGIFLSPSQVYWDDPTGCLDLIKDRDHKNLRTSTISSLYPDLHDFFVTDCGVLESPPSDKYFDILLQISHVKSPKEAAHGVFRVFLRWANDLKSGKMKSGQLLELINNLVKEDNTVLPTIQDRWVSLHPNFGLVCWTESKDLMEEFTDVCDVYFLYFGELTDAERVNLSGDVAKFLEEIGVFSLEKVICRKAIFYDVIDNSEEAFMVNWVLPFAQQYIYNKHPGVYLKLQEVAGEKLSQLNVIAVQRLFYQNTLKENTVSSRSRMICTCLLEGTTLYVTPDADSHSVILELSRLFFQGAPNLELANFLHSLILMSEVGSTKQQLELYIKQNQQLLEVPTGEMIWSLKSSTVSAEADSSILTPLPAVQMHIPQQRHSKKIKRKSNSSIWPPTSLDAAIYSPHMSTDDCPNRAEISDPKDEFERDPEDDCSKMVKISESMDSIETMELKDVPTCRQKDMLWSEHQNEVQSYRTGRAGELVAYKYFTEMLGQASVKWVNEAAESGLPYDITVTREDGSIEYVEVKATESGTKNWFIISPGEWDFAREKGDLFSVAWVLLPNSRKPKVLVLRNPLSLCREKVLNLVLGLTKTEDE